jgi:PKHD-type hydroxylase
MHLENYYYYFKGVLTPRFCNEVLEYGKTHKKETALIGNLKKDTVTEKQIKDLKKKRDSEIVWLDDPWIYREIQPYIQEANKAAKWNFDWNYSEACQFTKYSSGQYYDWHCDSWHSPYKDRDKDKDGKIRKLSVTCSLSDPSEYEGGELEFNFNFPDKRKKDNIKKCTEISPRGSIVVFPSFVWHRVCPVKRGTRYSLVVWNLGYPYR